MSTQTKVNHNDAFAFAWIVLVFISALSTLWLLILMFTFLDDAPVLLGWAALSLYSTIVLCIPFRRGEKWAWHTTWIQVILFASTIFLSGPEIGMKYLIAAGLMAVCLLLASPTFFRKNT